MPPEVDRERAELTELISGCAVCCSRDEQDRAVGGHGVAGSTRMFPKCSQEREAALGPEGWDQKAARSNANPRALGVGMECQVLPRDPATLATGDGAGDLGWGILCRSRKPERIREM